MHCISRQGLEWGADGIISRSKMYKCESCYVKKHSTVCQGQKLEKIHKIKIEPTYGEV